MRDRNLPWIACAVLSLAVGGGVTLYGFAAPGQNATDTGTLIKVALMGSDDSLVVSLVGDQVLSGTVQEITRPPYRLFVDFANVLPEVDAVTPVGRGGVDRIRVALNQADPPVTRVVLDLSQPSTYRVERDPVSREFRIIIGSAASVDKPVAMMTEPFAPAPVAGPASVLAADYTRWFARIVPEVEELLTSPSPSAGAVNRPPETLDGERRQQAWEMLRHEVSSATPPLYLQTAHALLKAAVDLGASGSDQSAERQPDREHAARMGAEMFLQRARALVDVLRPPSANIGQQ